MSKKRTTTLLSTYTQQQCQRLAMTHGSVTEAMAVAVDNLYRVEFQATYDLHSAVVARVRASGILYPLKDTILADWPEGDEHLRWALTAPEADIVDWVEAMRLD